MAFLRRTRKKYVSPYTDAQRKQFRLMVRERLDYWEPIVGKRASKFVVRDMSTRWGSCNTKTARLCFNLKLLDLPPEWLDYVIVHELTHLWEGNHSKAFWERMDVYYPEWKAVRKAMRTRQ